MLHLGMHWPLPLRRWWRIHSGSHVTVLCAHVHTVAASVAAGPGVAGSTDLLVAAAKLRVPHVAALSYALYHQELPPSLDENSAPFSALHAAVAEYGTQVRDTHPTSCVLYTFVSVPISRGSSIMQALMLHVCRTHQQHKP